MGNKSHKRVVFIPDNNMDGQVKVHTEQKSFIYSCAQ